MHVRSLPAQLPADRFWARLDRFECECPNCGSLIQPSRRPLPASLNTPARQRAAARRWERGKRVANLTWNPTSCRLVCPECNKVYVAGLLLYPVPVGSRRAVLEPPDTVPTARQRLQMRQQGGGWYANQLYRPGREVNVVIDSPCRCGEGWAPSCPVHGDPAQGGVEAGQLSRTEDAL